MFDTPVRAYAAESERCAASARDAEGDRDVAETPWAWSQRHALAAAVEPQALSWSRILALALALGLHLAVLLHLTAPPAAWLPPPVVTTIDAPTNGLHIVFVEPAAPGGLREAGADAIVTPRSTATPDAVPPTPVAPASSPALSTIVPIDAPRTVVPAATVEPRAADTLPSIADAPAPAARLFLPDGSVALPAAAIADLHAVESEKRAFDYMTPGLAGAASAFTRRQALTYAPTRFDSAWTGSRSLGDEIFIPIAEALTFENEKKSFRCSVLPPRCSWGLVVEAVELDDPTTLNPNENAQCRALWDAIVAATDQGDWLKRRARFDIECRKPLEDNGTPQVPRH